MAPRPRPPARMFHEPRGQACGPACEAKRAGPAPAPLPPGRHWPSPEPAGCTATHPPALFPSRLSGPSFLVREASCTSCVSIWSVQADPRRDERSSCPAHRLPCTARHTPRATPSLTPLFRGRQRGGLWASAQDPYPAPRPAVGGPRGKETTTGERSPCRDLGLGPGPHVTRVLEPPGCPLPSPPLLRGAAGVWRAPWAAAPGKGRGQGAQKRPL